MHSFYKNVDGTKFYCDADGQLVKGDNGEHVAVPDTDTKAVDINEVPDEVQKLLSEAYQKATAEGGEKAEEMMAKASEALDGFFQAVAEKAAKHSPKVEVVSSENQASFDVKAVTERIDQLHKSQSAGSISFKIKSEKDLEVFQKSTSRDDFTGEVLAPELDPEITRAPVRQPFMEEIADTVPTSADAVRYVEVVTESGAPATTAELAAIPEKDYAFQAFTKPVEKIAVANKHSVELLKYGPELVAAVRNMLRTDLQIATDSQLLNGNGTTPNLQGVLGVAPELDATAIGTQSVANANLFDVLRIAGTKIANAGKGKFIPNFVVLHPDDTEAFDLTKNADGDYIMPPFYDAQGRRIRGARIIENTGIASGTFLMGDFRYMHVRPNGGVEVELTNSDGTDFMNDILTIKMRRFISAYVKSNDNGAFMTGDISAAITELTD